MSSGGGVAGSAQGGPGAAMHMPMSAPYPPKQASLGTPPTPNPDTAVSAVFLALFLITGALHMKLFQGNRKAQHRFIFSGAMFAFCIIRVVSTSLRISWAYRQTNVKLAIAAQIFVAAGTVILFIINLFFTQRLMRARHPHIGWTKPFKILIPPVSVGLTVIGLIMVITVVIQTFYTLNPNTLRIDRDVQLAVLCWFTFVAFLPIPIVLAMLALPRRTYIDKFGAGRFRTKIGLLLASSALLTLGAGFRCGTSFMPPVPRTATPWYFDKACFYVFDFTVEFLVVMLYLLVRVDRRFFVPDDAAGPGEYSGDVVHEKPEDDETEVYTLQPDGHTMSLADGRTVSLRDGPAFSLTAASARSESFRNSTLHSESFRNSTLRSESMRNWLHPQQPAQGSFTDGFTKEPSNDTESMTSSMLGLNPKTGRYDLKFMSDTSSAGGDVKDSER